MQRNNFREKSKKTFKPKAKPKKIELRSPLKKDLKMFCNDLGPFGKSKVPFKKLLK